MAILKCKMCGGDLNITADETVVECEYCGSKQTVPTADNEKKMNLFARANRLLRNCEFDKAAGIYESIVAEFTEEAEAYWGLVLCKYGIEYVDDPATGNKVPTCHRSSFDSVMDDKDFELVMEYADGIARRVYREQAKQMEELRKAIIEVSGKEEPYDIFISYKETDDSGERTLDSVIAQDIYTELTGKGYRVFFSRISLEDKLGTEYEPYIFAALNSAKVMLVVGTDYDYFNAVWVKNEWSRFLALIAKGEKKTLIPVFKNIDAYDMPKEFAKLSAQDMGKVGAMQDLLRGVDKILGKSVQLQHTSQPTQTANTPTVNSYLKRINLFLEDKDFPSAEAYCEKVLDIDAENAQAYLFKLMIEHRCSVKEDLQLSNRVLDESANYKKAIRFGDEAIIDELTSYNEIVKQRIEIISNKLKLVSALKGVLRIKKLEEEQIARDREEQKALISHKNDIYNRAVRVMSNASTENQFTAAAEMFEEIQEFKDADSLAKQCIEKADIARKDAIYSEAKSKMTGEYADKYDAAINLFEQIAEWNDATELIAECRKNIEEIKAKEEVARLAHEQDRKKLIELMENKATVDVEIERKKVELSQLGVFKRREKKQLQDELSELKVKKEELEFTYFNLELEKLNQAHTNDIACFGRYMRTDKGDVEPIEWQVLKKTDNKLLLISKCGLTAKQYNATGLDITWEDSTLRSWLNRDFVNSAFSYAEQTMIAITNVSADKNPNCSTKPGNATKDKVFLLSISEAEKYFLTNESRRCAPTTYAKARGAYTSANYKTASGEAACQWWLRSPGNYQRNAAYVLSGGSVYYGGCSVDLSNYCVRPALWINLDA